MIERGAVEPLAAEPTAAMATVKVWDPLVRLFHWGVVLGVVLNLFVLADGKTLHRWVGYSVIGLLFVRIVWGFVGTRYARFSSFFPTPHRLVPYTRAVLKGREKRQLGHNPLAAVMMFVLMGLLALTTLTGYIQTLDAYWGVKWVKQAHALFANGIMVLAGIHALAALVESWRHRENLVWSMVTGRKRPIEADATSAR